MSSVDPKNRLNDLSSREWLPFQKSWFLLGKNPLPEFINFFTKSNYPDVHTGTVAVYPDELLISSGLELNSRKICTLSAIQHQKLDYVYIDLTAWQSLVDLNERIDEIRDLMQKIEQNLNDRGYITVVAKNWHHAGGSELVAWEIARLFGACFQQKDEKIGCGVAKDYTQMEAQNGWSPHNSVTYFLQFRKEKERVSGLKNNFSKSEKLPQNMPEKGNGAFRDAWFVHRPPRREKGVLLHPAKFPEDLVERFITNFTRPGEVVLDPMAGTGSTLIAALDCQRIACGIELNPEFVEIAKSRFSAGAQYQLVTGDAADQLSYSHLPAADYCITSPPYWDMLRMRGSETQKKRKDAGLQRWYSDDPKDAGNIEDY